MTPTTITLVSEESFDENGVQYFFDSNTPGAHDSGWIDTNTYTDVNLSPGTTYCYRVRARDMSANQNETPYSSWSCFTTSVAADSTAPTPNPMEFDPNGLPREFEIPNADPEFDYWVEMMAVTAVDDSGGAVEYYFECESPYGAEAPAGLSSGWQTSPIYTVRVGRRGQGLRFRVYARDASGNPTAPSQWVPSAARPDQPALNNGNNAAGGGVVTP